MSHLRFGMGVASMLAACGIGGFTTPILKLDKSWAMATPGTGFTGRFKQGFAGPGATPLPADPSFTIQQQSSFLANFERVIGNWSEPDSMIVPQEDCPGGKFRMGIEAWHATGIHHINVYAEGGIITIPGSALGMLSRTDPVTGIVWNNPNHYVFDLALPDSYNNASYGAAGNCGLVADIFPNAGFPLRIGKTSAHLQGYPAASVFTPLMLTFDPYGYIYGDDTGSRCVKVYVATPQATPAGNDTTGTGSAAAPYATYVKAWSKISSTKPTQVIFDNGVYPELTTTNRGQLTTPTVPWLRAKNSGAVTLTGAKYGWASTDITSGNQSYNGGFFVGLNDVLFDGVNINTAHMTIMCAVNRVFTRRSMVIDDFGAYNGPAGSDYCLNGPRIDRIYGIYNPIGWGTAPSAAVPNGSANAAHKFSRDYWHTGGSYTMESAIITSGNCQTIFRRNCVSKTAGDGLRSQQNLRVFGSKCYVTNPSVERNHKEECLLVASATFANGTTTITFQNNPDGSAPTLYFAVAGSWLYVADPASPFYLGAPANYGGYNSCSLINAVANGGTSITTQNGVDLSSMPVGTPIYFGGVDHGDYLQMGTNQINTSTTVLYDPTYPYLVDNGMITHTTMTGRPSSNPFTMSTATNTPLTTKYTAPDASVSVVTATLVVDATGQLFSTMYGGAAIPILWLGRGYGMSLTRAVAGSFFVGGTVAAYNNTTSAITDPIYGVLQPGQGVFSYPSAAAKNFSGVATCNGGWQNFAWINVCIHPGETAGIYATGSVVGALKNWLWLGVTLINGTMGGPNQNGTIPSSGEVESWYIADSIFANWTPWPSMNYSNNVYTVSTPFEATSVQITDIGLPGLSTAWSDPLVPPAPTKVTKAVAGSMRKFDAYGTQIVVGVSPVGARAA